MLKEAIYHRPKNNFAYAYDKDTLHIRIQTKRNDVTSVMLHAKDPFSWNGVGMNWTTFEMKKMGCNEWFDYWQVEIQPLNKRMEYFFQLQDEEEIVYVSERKITHSRNEINEYFKFPFLNEIDVMEVPKWVKNTVWYQIFPERFANGNRENNPVGTLEWGSQEPKGDSYFGGDLRGIIEHVDYLAELGISGIYLTPIFQASSNHKYDTIDYFKIDKDFGTKEDLKELVKECHARGIRVMLDAVFNHAGYYFKPFQDVLEKGASSKFKDWFHIHEYPIVTEPIPNYDTFAFTHMMPKLNTENQQVKQYLLDVATYWVQECDIDGWRLDVANEVDHHFWREFRKEVKKFKKDVYILGEVWHDAMPWLMGDQFDAVMNYPFTNLAIRLIANESISTKEFIYGMHELSFQYPKQVHEYTFNLLGSHDTARILNVAGMNKEKVMALWVLLLFVEGSPCIYYGDEIGMDGENDPGCRKCMVWEEEKQDIRMREHLKRLIHIKKEWDNASHNETVFVEKNEMLYLTRVEKEQIYTMIINPTAHSQVISDDLEDLNIIEEKGLEKNTKNNVLKAYGYMFFKK